MKKTVIALTFIAILTAKFWANPLWAQTADDFSVTLTRDGTGIVVTGYAGSSRTVNIPKNIQGLPVKEIGTRAFRGSTITAVSIPENVTIIGANAFSGSEQLFSVSLPSTLESIGREAFHGCTALTSITIPQSVTRIDQNAFANTGLRTVEWPASVAIIGEYMFRECVNLESVILPEGLTGIGNGAFYRCSVLTNINMPSTLKNIGNLSFTGCIAIPLGTQAAIKRAGYRGNF